MARKPLPKEIQEAVLVSSRRRCCLCYGLSRDITEKRGQIAHIDRNAENNDLANLAYLCLEHHDRYDSRPSQSKGFLPEEIRRYMQELYGALTSSTISETILPTYEVVPQNLTQQPEANYPGYLNVSKLPAADARVFLPETSTQALVRTSRGISPLSRAAFVEATYCGRWIRSSGVIVRVIEGDDCYVVQVAVDDVGFVNLTFPTSWRANVEPLREGDRIQFEGQIRDVHEVCVELVRPSIGKHLRQIRPTTCGRD